MEKGIDNTVRWFFGSGVKMEDKKRITRNIVKPYS
jgi:hypothetical protein